MSERKQDDTIERPRRPSDVIGSVAIDASIKFAEEVIKTTDHSPSRVRSLALCFLATLEDLHAAERELTELKLENLETHTKEPAP